MALVLVDLLQGRSGLRELRQLLVGDDVERTDGVGGVEEDVRSNGVASVCP
jgi:hypothetical protein